eukprot:GFYU01008105.1.p1 GENE.GFYU01008105.1~~GFYU01008105.1.p1  ORF type:complete len:130 (-),score=30.00 GFYU01008105.1:357-746(-)
MSTTTKPNVCGMLWKKGDMSKRWRERWFVLQDDKLWYYQSQTHAKAVGHIPLALCVVRESKDRCDFGHLFEVVTNQKVYELVASQYSDMTMWMRAISHQTALATENELIAEAEERICQQEHAKVTNLLA